MRLYQPSKGSVSLIFYGCLWQKKLILLLLLLHVLHLPLRLFFPVSKAILWLRISIFWSFETVWCLAKMWFFYRRCWCHINSSCQSTRVVWTGGHLSVWTETDVSGAEAVMTCHQWTRTSSTTWSWVVSRRTERCRSRRPSAPASRSSASSSPSPLTTGCTRSSGCPTATPPRRPPTSSCPADSGASAATIVSVSQFSLFPLPDVVRIAATRCDVEIITNCRRDYTWAEYLQRSTQRLHYLNTKYNPVPNPNTKCQTSYQRTNGQSICPSVRCVRSWVVIASWPFSI